MAVSLRSPVRPAHAASVIRYAGIASGDVVAVSGDKVDAIGDKPLGIVVGEIPATNPQARFPLAVEGDIIFDDALASQTTGALVFSDGDGTYSTTEPAGAAGTQVWAIGHIEESDADGTAIRLDFQLYEKAV